MTVWIYTFVCPDCSAGWTTEDSKSRTCLLCGQPGLLRDVYARVSL